MDRIETLLRVLVSVLLYEECSLLWRLVRGFLLAYEDMFSSCFLCRRVKFLLDLGLPMIKYKEYR